MKVIYSCYGGAHSSPVVAAIHLGRLPEETVPTNEDLKKTHYYDKIEGADHGRIFAAGIDEYGNEIYVFGRGSADLIAKHALMSGWLLADRSPSEIMFIDTLPTVNVLMRIGGFLSRFLGFVSLGRPLVMAGTRKAYSDMVKLVRDVKNSLESKQIPLAGEVRNRSEN